MAVFAGAKVGSKWKTRKKKSSGSRVDHAPCQVQTENPGSFSVAPIPRYLHGGKEARLL
jgi:hypothetical protein